MGLSVYVHSAPFTLGLYMQLSDLILDIKDELNKGAAVTDAQVTTQIKNALNLLELEQSWEYMDRFVTFTFDITSAEPRALAFPARLKSFEFFRIIKDNGKFHYLDEKNPREFTSIETAIPDFYFKDGMEFIWVDNIPDKNYVGEISYSQFTRFENSETFEPWLFEAAPTLIKYNALLLMTAGFLREPELGKVYEKFATRALKAALDTNYELKYSNHKMQMGFGHDHHGVVRTNNNN